MSFFRTIFHRGPTKAQQHVDLWMKDRGAAIAEYRKSVSENGFDAVHPEFQPMLDAEQFCRKWEAAAEKERIQDLRAALPKQTRFTRLRMSRGLPFKSHRQPV